MTESVPVKVPFGHSDIDLIAVHPRGDQITLPNRVEIGPRVIVETKDEHDCDPKGGEFGKMLAADLLQFDERGFIPVSAKGAKFSMLREQHFAKATEFLGSNDFDRLFVVHSINVDVLVDAAERRSAVGNYWLMVTVLVGDLI